MLIGMRNAMFSSKRLPYDAEVEYLESTGTQWIDTQVAKDTSTVVQARFSTTQANPNDVFLFGVINRPLSTAYRFALQVNGAQHILYPYTGTGIRTYVSFLDNTSHSIQLDSAGHFVINGTTHSVAGADNFSTEKSLYLFARNNAINNSVDGTGGLFRVYYFQIYSGEILVRDYIPVRKGNVGYMYDRVSGQLFGNQGTGAFLYGNDI